MTGKICHHPRIIIDLIAKLMLLAYLSDVTICSRKSVRFLLRGSNVGMRHDDAIDQLKAEVHCGTVLEQQAPAWQLDQRQGALLSPGMPVFDRWCARPPLAEGTPAWRYLSQECCLPPRILALVAWHGLVREGPGSSAWFAHQDQAGKLTGIEMHGPRWRGFAADSDTSLFQLPGGDGIMPRLTVVGTAIDALSLASLEGPRGDTLYLATAGGMGSRTVATLRALLTRRARLATVQLVVASDADVAGEQYASLLAELAQAAGVTCERLRPPRALGRWNAILVRAAGRGHRHAA